MRSYRQIDTWILFVTSILGLAAEVPVPLSVECPAKESKNWRSNPDHTRSEQLLLICDEILYAGFFHSKRNGELFKKGLCVNVLSHQPRQSSEAEENETCPLHLAFSAKLGT
jgi:hypothetical protein